MKLPDVDNDISGKFEKSRKDKSGNWLYRKTCCVYTAATKRCRDYLNIIKFEIYTCERIYEKIRNQILYKLYCNLAF